MRLKVKIYKLSKEKKITNYYFFTYLKDENKSRFRKAMVGCDIIKTKCSENQTKTKYQNKSSKIKIPLCDCKSKT